MKFFVSAIFCFLGFGLVRGQDDGGCTATGMEPYDYAQVLCMSSLFFEAQRSGYLPDDNRIDWRGDSALTDGEDVGFDFVGGYYDAGDFVKFGFPMSYTVTALAFGLVSYPDGYEAAGQTDYARAAIKWGSDYILKAKTGTTEFYGQVGDGGIDHAYWGRPEEMTMERPSAKIDASLPGTDLAGESAAALAATSIVFQDADPTYSAQCLTAARELFEFADQYRGFYSSSIQGAAGYYLSYSWEDELPWAALWLYKATGEEEYLTRAKDFMTEFGLLEMDTLNFDWDDKKAGIYTLLVELDGSQEYVDRLTSYVDCLINEQQHTPLGLIYIMQWGTLRHAMNVVFAALRAASLGINTDTYRSWAQQQVDYALGSTGHSFVVGYGVDPPQRPHHRSSSCPDLPDVCDWQANSSPDPNPQTLFGALVGGPDEQDNYVDDRTDYIHNEVACDYNALFTGVLAAMVELH